MLYTANAIVRGCERVSETGVFQTGTAEAGSPYSLCSGMPSCSLQGEAGPLDSLIANLTAGRERLQRAEAETKSVPSQRGTSEAGNESRRPTMSLAELDLHAARVGGTLECLVELSGLPPKAEWGKGMQLRMLRLSLDFLGARENCEASLCSCSAHLCALVRRALTALNVCTAARALSSTPTSTGPTSPARGGCNTSENTADGEHCDEDGLSGDTELENDEHLAAVLLHLIARVVGARPTVPYLEQRHATFVSFVISSGQRPAAARGGLS